MRCPNCGKEAIFVNGKYVCLDCGIEITTEQQAAQNMNEPQVFDSAIPNAPPIEINPVVAESAPVAEQAGFQEAPTATMPTEVVVPEPEAQTEPTISESMTSTAEPAVAPYISESIETAVEPSVAGSVNVMAGVADPVQDSNLTTATVDPTIESVATPEPAKPVQEYYEKALRGEDPSVSGSGVYDFSTPPINPVVPGANESADSEPTISSLSSDMTQLATPDVPVETPASSQPEPASYFSPNSFNMANDNSVTDGSNTPADLQGAGFTTPPSSVVPTTDDLAIPSTPSIPETPSENVNPQNPVLPTMSPGATVTPTVEPGSIFANTPAVETKTLDEMLGEATAAVPIADSPISAYGQSLATPTLENIKNESAMPSVESVFGSQSSTPPNPNLPTAQDFGVPPKTEPPKRPEWLMPVLVAGGALVVLVGIALTVLALTNKKPAVNYPVTLTDEDITTFSAGLATAMQAEKGVASDFSLKADFSNVTIKDEVADKVTLEKQLGSPFELTGTWYTDADGDISTDTAVGEDVDKRTYIKSSSETYVYSPSTQQYNKESGLNLAGVPALFEAEDKAASFYTTNINSASLVAKEMIDGAEYSKYELNLSEDIVKKTLAVLGGAFKDTDYKSLITDNLKVLVWVGSDNKLKKVAFDGEVEVETAELRGSISLSGEAIYQYLSVSIDSPTSPPGTTSDTGAPVSAGIKNEEEGQTSFIDKKGNEVIEAKG